MDGNIKGKRKTECHDTGLDEEQHDDDTKKTALNQDEWRYIGDLTDR